jgi:hypothetical protein
MLRPPAVERPEPGLRRLPGPVNTGAALPHGNRFCGGNRRPGRELVALVRATITHVQTANGSSGGA